MPFGEVVLSRRGGRDPRRVACFGTRVSWQVSTAGQLSTMIPLSEVERLGWPDFKAGWEVFWEHPSGPKFAGDVTGDPRRSGAWEIAAESKAARMRRRRTPRLFRTVTATAGAQALRLVNAVDYAGPLGYASITADEGGESVRLDDRAMDLYTEALPNLTRLGFEYDVTWDGHFRFRRQIGTDRTATVHLCEGRHIVDPWSQEGDVWTVINDLVGIPAKRGYAESRAYIAEHGDSIRDYGRKQDTLVIPNASKHTLTPILTEALKRTATPLLTQALTIADVDGCFGWFGLGDTIRVTLGSAGNISAYRPLSIAIDEDSGLMACSGTVTSVIAEAA